MIKARGACKQGAGQWSDERRLLIKPGSLSLSISLFLSLSAGRAKYGVEWYGKGGRQWEITLVHGIIVHAFRRVTARRHRWSRLRRNAQRRPLLPVAPALVVPPTLLVCSRIADHRRFFTNFVHAIQDKKKKKNSFTSNHANSYPPISSTICDSSRTFASFSRQFYLRRLEFFYGIIVSSISISVFRDLYARDE